MHGRARLVEMLNDFSDEVHLTGFQNESKNAFLLDEIRILEVIRGPGLPGFIPRAAFLILLEKKVARLSSTAFKLDDTMWTYIEKTVISVLKKYSDKYPELFSSMSLAVQDLVAMKRKQSEVWVRDVVEMEKMANYTGNPEYEASWRNLMVHQKVFVEILKHESKPVNMDIDGYGTVDVSHLRGRTGVVHDAFDLNMRLIAYWKILHRRLVDRIAVHLLFCIQNLVNKEMEVQIIKVVNEELEGKWPEWMLEELPVVAEERKRLNNTVALLKESKDVLAKISDDIAGISMRQVI
ncbi:Dynamin-related protein 4C [Striga hermonthica]|uniref:Dynamin-related protein 4C n=1 Tax=Striga hermonthica TaxID=68872 RepID=A0A9N7MQ30_STRHE|nr:Dynamin-related protein 4C [Striga hermonthica]